MVDRPIIFSGPMVRALLDGRKTQTRRLASSPLAKCQPGDRLWVRECFAVGNPAHYWGSPIYRATFGAMLAPICEGFTPWRPSIHMPRWASRLTLTVTEVRRQRLRDISEADARAEGPFVGKATGRIFMNETAMRLGGDQWATARDWFADLWETLHGAGSWDANPEIVALTFTAECSNIDAPAAVGDQP